MSKAPPIAFRRLPQKESIIDRAVKPESGARQTLGTEAWRPAGRSRSREEAGDIEERRSEPRYACNHAACVASANRDIAISGRIVSISASGARVEVMYPRRGPSTTFLFDLVNGLVYECEVLWRSDFHIGVRFLDVLGPSRRRRLQTGGDVTIRQSSNPVIQLEEPPKEELQPGSPPAHILAGESQKPTREPVKPKPSDGAVRSRSIRKAERWGR